jgi:hypothetical protein
MSRYAIWNKKDEILTPIGEVIPAEKWIERYPIARLDSIKIVCAGGEINGAFFGTLGQMVESYTREGCDFSACVTDQDKLDAIEAFEDARNTPSGEPTAEERIAAALEYQNMLAE